MRGALLVTALVVGLALVGAVPVPAQCTVTTTPMDFGDYDVFDTSHLASTASVTYFCAPPNQSIMIQIDAGGSGTFFSRQMTRGAERLDYNLYRDAAATQVWGDGSGGTVVFNGTTGSSGPPSGRTFTVPVYGRIPAGQSPAVGVYTDTVTITLVF